MFRGASNRNAAEDIVILITDAMGTEQNSQTEQKARLLREDGARVFAIGIGGEEVRMKGGKVW